jgi:hypothetical protein
MKKIYLLLLPVLFLWGSCSMDDVLESNGELNLTVIETNNPNREKQLYFSLSLQPVKEN